MWTGLMGMSGLLSKTETTKTTTTTIINNNKSVLIGDFAKHDR